MVFSDEFAWSHRLNGKWPLDRVVDRGLRANLEMQKMVKSTFEQGIERLAKSNLAASTAIQDELAYQAERIGQQIMEGSRDIVGAVEQGSADIVNSIQQMSDYLGAGLSEVRWAVERHAQVSENILMVMLNSLSNESRQYF